MIDFKRLRELKDARAAEEPSDPAGGLGVGKGWRDCVVVLAGIVAHWDDEERFAAHEPRFNRAIKDFRYWVGRLKQDAETNGFYHFRDHDFDMAYCQLLAAFNEGGPNRDFPSLSGRRRDIAAKLRDTLHTKFGYIPRSLR